jgi:hypothetical protein
MNVTLAVAAALGLSAVAHGAPVLCQKGRKVLVRDPACKGKETQLNLADFGAGTGAGTGTGVSIAIAYGRVNGSVATAADGLLPGAVGIASATRQPDTTYVAKYRLVFSPGFFSAAPSVVVAPESAATDGTEEDNICVVEALSATQVDVVCADIGGNVGLGNPSGQEVPDATKFTVVALGAP